VEGLTAGGDTLVIERADDGIPHFSTLPLTGGTPTPIAAMDGGSALFDDTRAVIGAEVDTSSGIRYSFFDPAKQKLWDAIARAFPGEFVRLASWTQDWSKLILRVEGPKSGAAFFLLDTKTRHADWLADEYTGILPENVAEVRAIHYAASDGLDIPAYLTLPRGVQPKGLPLVVLVHGGPQDHDRPGFDWWSQALASLGYAVLQPEFRGSSGVTPGFTAAGFGQWGRKMQTDLSDGVSYLSASGIVDPKRVCIAGASYGGYAAMAGVTLQAGIYRCAISVAGLSDLHRHLVDTGIETWGDDNIVRRYWLRFLGATGESDPLINQLSPVRHLDRLTVPLLLVHGTFDSVVQPSQSKEMFEAATKAGKQVSFVSLQGEDHNLARSATRLQMLQAMADFLRANLSATAGTTH
jgi:dipeptidyl aminopeptidase/acylaminoacyl peptidase